jgi:two-component system, response regulator YesN
MLNLLIVDDEELDREGLVSELEWEQYGISEIKAARTGTEALEIMKEYEPHILMTDIKMPVMNGLQLAENAKKLFPNIKVVFISGYDSFEYAQYAIKLNVCGYLLKPVDTSELAHVIVNVVDDIMKERSSMEKSNMLSQSMDESRPFLKTRLLSNLFYGTYEDESEFVNRANYLGLSFVTGKYLLLLAQIDDYAQWASSLKREENEKVCLDICNIACEMGNTVYSIESVFIDLQTCAVLISCDSHVPEELIFMEAYAIAEKLIRSVKELLNISISVGVSSVLSNLGDMQHGFNDCSDALKIKMYAGKGKVNCKPKENQAQNIKLTFENMDVELSKLLITGDRSRIINTIDHTFGMLENSRISDNQLIQNLCINIISRMNITVLEMGLDLNDIFGGGALLVCKLMSFETILDIRMWMKNIFISVLEYHEQKQKDKHSSTRREFQKYIEEHYQQDITLKELAEEWHYSPNYLGNIFKQDFGKGFSEYLAEYRMKKAALLLKNYETKIYEVAHQVGYNNISSFIKQFKQAYDITPAEYRVNRE